MNLFAILEEQILNEGRKEDVMAKYPEATEVIEALAALDPSGSNKYLDWAAKAYISIAGNRVTQEYVQSLMDYIKTYHEKQASITPKAVEDFLTSDEVNKIRPEEILKIKEKPKDINSFDSAKSFGVFVDFINSYKSKKKELDEIKKESDRIYEDDEILILSPRTHRSSCHYGKHSTWCVATSNTNYYANYTSDGHLYFFLSKKDIEFTPNWGDSTERHDGGQPAHTPPFKTALLIKDDGDITWWSKGDRNYASGDLLAPPAVGWVGDSKLPFLTEDMANKILSYNKMAIQNRMQRQIEALMKSKGFYDASSSDKSTFLKLVKSNIFEPEQLSKIIKNDNWTILYENTDTSKMIRKELGRDLVFNLVKDLLKKSESMADTLKKFSDNNFLTSYDGWTEEQSREIVSIITKKLGATPTNAEVGMDTRVFIDKWTMSPEQWEKYNSTSSYIVMGELIPGKSPKINQIVKIDKFKLTDRELIKKLQLQAKIANSNLYGVVTEKDLLDPFMDNISDITPEMASKVFQKTIPVYIATKK